MGSKEQRANQHIRRIERKIRQYTAKGLNTDKLNKELGFAKDKSTRPEHKTGREADARTKK